MSDEQCCKTPILDLLRFTPIDGRATYEEGEGVSLTYHMIPYGHHCHEAADEIERLREELQAEKGNTTFLAGQLGEQEDDKKALRKRIAELEGYIRDHVGVTECVGFHKITDAQIDAAEKHILTSSLEWIRAFAYGVLFELGLLDESGVSVLARSVDGESGLPNTAKVGRVQPDESEAASRHFITGAQIDKLKIAFENLYAYVETWIDDNEDAAVIWGSRENYREVLAEIGGGDE